ncbi:alpha/beta hydrolase [Reinekea marina]|uniref:Alpha/beta hydrolase n=1 Tax=Reinekea marina TaxID=1310421 RepID=A0ABV7WWV1_9GAMM
MRIYSLITSLFKHQKLWLGLLVFSLSSCSMTPTLQYAGANSAFERYQIADKVSLDELDFVEVHYATNRLIQSPGKLANITDDRGSLTYGASLISIPKATYQTADAKLAFVWGPVGINRNPSKNIFLHDVSTLNPSEFFHEVSHTEKSQNDHALLYVHGYNVTFENAIRIAAQLKHDMGFSGLAFAFSWPSRGNFAQYTVDEANVEWSKVDFIKTVKSICDQTQVKTLDIIAHSMGSRLVTSALINLFNDSPSYRKCLGELVLASPDIDADYFKRDLLPRLSAHHLPITLYSSSKDVALKASKTIHGKYPRAGESGKDITVAKGVETIDTSEVSDSMFGHSDYAETAILIKDLSGLLVEGKRAEQREHLVAVPYQNTELNYWILRHNLTQPLKQ